MTHTKVRKLNFLSLQIETIKRNEKEKINKK